MLQTAVVAVVAYVVYTRLENTAHFFIGVVGLVVLVPVATALSRRVGSHKHARQGRWSKMFRTISVEIDETRRSHGPAYLVVTDEGVEVRRRTSSRWGSATYETAVDTAWSAITRVEYTPGRLGWWNPVISGTGVKIAPAGSVNRRFREALERLGARID